MREARSALTMRSLSCCGQRARLDHAPAKDLQRISHRRDLVALAAAMNFCIEIAARQKLHRALQIADPPQDVAADIEPDEQQGSDEGEAAERKHDYGGERNLPARLPGRGVGLGLHAIDELLHADAEADIELAGFVQNELMLLTVSPRAATTVLSASSSMIWPSLSTAPCWVSFIFLARSFSASSLPEASSAGPSLARLALSAANCRLAARRGMSRPLRSSIDPPRCPSTMPAPALITTAMPAITPKAANKLPLTPHFRRWKPRPRNLPIVDRNAMLSASRSLHPRDEFRQYHVTRVIKS